MDRGKQRAEAPCFGELVWPPPCTPCPRRPWPGGPRAQGAASGLCAATCAVPLKKRSPHLVCRASPSFFKSGFSRHSHRKSQPSPEQSGRLRAATARSPDGHARLGSQRRGRRPPPRPGCAPPALSPREWTHSVGGTVGRMLVLRGLVPLVGGDPAVHEPGRRGTLGREERDPAPLPPHCPGLLPLPARSLYDISLCSPIPSA